MFEHEESKKKELIQELKKGVKKSGFIENFSKDDFLNSMHDKLLNEF